MSLSSSEAEEKVYGAQFNSIAEFDLPEQLVAGARFSCALPGQHVQPVHVKLSHHRPLSGMPSFMPTFVPRSQQQQKPKPFLRAFAAMAHPWGKEVFVKYAVDETSVANLEWEWKLYNGCLSKLWDIAVPTPLGFFMGDTGQCPVACLILELCEAKPEFGSDRLASEFMCVTFIHPSKRFTD
jgi:hypothetical protein